MSQLRRLLAGLSLAAVLFAPAADAKRLKRLPLKVNVVPTAGNLTVRVKTRPKATCKLNVTVRGQSAKLPKRTAGKKGKTAFNWGVPGDAPSGTWSFRVKCKRGSKSRTVTKTALIVTPANGTGQLVEQSALRPQIPPAGAKVPTVRVDIPGRGGGGDPGDDYPAALKNVAQDSVIDQWGMYNRECVSWVAWALASRNGFNMPFFDHAKGWADKARARGFRVDTSPANGSVAWSNAGDYGHVAYVQEVRGSNVYIQEYNRDLTGHYGTRIVPANTFTGYIHFADRTESGNVSPPGETVGPGVPLMGDVDGDGTDDAVMFFKDSGDWYVALSTRSSFNSNVGRWQHGYGIGSTKQFLEDVDGDGRADAVTFFKDTGTWDVALSTGAGSFNAVVGEWKKGLGSDSANQLLADVNGDGRADAVAFLAGPGNWDVALSTGSAFGDVVGEWKKGFGSDAAYQLLADVNGDGRADAVAFLAGPGNWDVALSTGSAFGDVVGEWKKGFGSDAANQLLADVNGDGRADAVAFLAGPGNWDVALSTGSAFGDVVGEWIKGYGIGSSARFLADADGDGRSDAIAFFRDSGSWDVSLSDGGRFNPNVGRWISGHGAGS